MNRQKKENGVALLFALGLLSLMSVLGVAFVANALTAQKTAVNLGARNQARIVLDSALNRVMITIMGLLRQDDSTTDFSVIYSTNDGNDRTTDLSAENLLFTHDQLSDTKNSKLNMALSGLPKYDGSKSKSTWVYVRDNEGKIIARMAYQVLPTGTSSLSLDQVLKGIYNPLTKALVEGTDKNTISWNQRIGKDINELYIGKAAAFRQEWSVDNDANDSIPATSGNVIVSSFGEFFNTDIYKIIGDPSDTVNDSKRRVWLRRWFSESAKASPEVFYVTGDTKTKMEEATAYHRFNLGPITGIASGAAEKWYPRIKEFVKSNGKLTTGPYDDTIKNSEKAVDHLLSQSLKFYPEDSATPAGSGISYLRKIAKNKGTFTKIEDRRRQIAANLNDYCDEDSIPTSDKAAADWSNTNSPTYTGNEKTPYINEFALGFKFVPTKNDVSGDIDVKVTPEILTELIDIYGVKDPDQEKKYNLKLWLKNEFTLKVLSASGTVTYSGGTTEEFSVDSCDNSGDKTGEAPVDLFEMEVSSNDFSNGYIVARKELPPLNLKFILKDKILAKLNAKGDKTVSKVQYDSLILQVSNVKFGLNAAALFDKTDSTNAYGVDFVRGPTEEIVSVSAKNITLKSSDTGFEPNITSGEKSNAWQYFYLTGMEVRDPRQNLNFNKNTTKDIAFVNAKSDWKSVPTIEYNSSKTGSDDKFEFEHGSIEIDYSNANPSYVGIANKCSNPSKPFSPDDLFNAGEGTPGTDFDKENATDPAAAGKDNPRLSTAFIRNAPMQSLWELGAIHRASAWETINIKGAVISDGSTVRRIELSDNKVDVALDAEGIDYIDGDGILLDQVKLTSDAYSGGKLDVNMLHEVVSAPEYDLAWNDDMCRALLANVRYGQQISDLYTLPENPVANTTGTVIDWGNVPVTHLKTVPAGRSGNNANKYVSRADFVQGAENPNDPLTRFLANGYGLINNYDSLADAQQEELVGKTVNLLTAGATAPTTIQAVVVVQTINGIKVPSGESVTIIRPVVKKNGKTDSILITKDSNDLFVKSYVYDTGVEKYVYSDEITSELRALVTIKKINDASGIRLQLHSIQYY